MVRKLSKVSRAESVKVRLMDRKVHAHFQKADPVLYTVLLKVKPLKPLKKSETLFKDLCEAIINQQLSDKASTTIFGRFKKLFQEEEVTPEKVLKVKDETIRNAGPSWSKVRYIKNLAQLVHDGTLDLDVLSKKDNEQIIGELTKVKGIGMWTAEMFLMFSLGREDVFSYGDLGLGKAIKKLYKLTSVPSKKKVESIVERWKPYRTYACQILWRSLNDTKT